jgi:DNA mismatch repair protein MutL
MIRRLSKEVVERIAAGEVIERPASVVKELVENALDAGAKRVAVELENGGKSRIRVVDDGIGMDVADLELAFVPHATSKLAAVDDLLAIASFGFRGEALASIGAVSRARIVSRRHDAAEGHEIRCESGVIGMPRPAGAPPGTTIEAANLFFNVPARSRFLKGDPAEASRCLEVVARIALVAEGVAFRVRFDERVVFEVGANAGRRERAGALLGEDVAAAMLELDRRDGEVKVQGLLARPAEARAAAPHQYVFLNGRYVKDATIRQAVRQAYREFMAPSLQAQYVLSLAIDPGEVDVNVHPAKIEVRFRDSNAVFRGVYGAVLDALRRADLTPRPGHEVARAPRADHGGAPSREASRGVTPWPPPTQRFDGAAAPLATPGGASPSAPSSGAEAVREDAGFVPAVPPRTGAGLLRVFATYVLYEADGDLIVVDQHALHERVVFERLRTALDRGPLPMQRLLAPVVIEIGRPAVAGLEERAGELARFGFEVTAFSATALAVHAVPPLLGTSEKRLIDAIFALLGADDPLGRAARAPLEERLHTMACRAAVKAGDSLAPSEIEALLDAAAALPEAKACPHGRPTAIRLGKRDLENWFKRTGF